MNIENKKRDYKKESDRDKELYKKYTFRVSKNLATAFDEKLKKDQKNYTKFFNESIEKYLKK